jgi:hypothetical protein
MTDYRMVIIIIFNIISFMYGIYTYIPETNNVPREYIVAAILLLLFMVPISLVPALALLCFYVSTFRSKCSVPNMAVFCSSLTYYYYYYYYYTMWASTASSHRTSFTKALCPSSKESLTLKRTLYIIISVKLYFSV